MKDRKHRELVCQFTCVFSAQALVLADKYLFRTAQIENNFPAHSINSADLQTMPTVLLLNGPNLNLLGTREPEIYGSMNLSGIEEQVSAVLHEHKIECETFQSNSEGELIDWLHQHKNAEFLLLNPGALTHNSIGLRDAVLGIEIPFLEIHLSNVHQREEFRHHSFFSDIAIGSLVGLGVKGYLLAAQFAVDFIEQKGTSAGNR